MDDIGDKINAILSDPDQFGKIAQMAKSIMGGEPDKSREKAKSRDDDDSDGGGFDLNPAMLSRISKLMQKSGTKSSDMALLEAMKPFLSDKRRKKMDKAMKLAKLASFAELAAEEFKEDADDV